MRKYLALVLGVLFILSFTVIAFAGENQSDITLSGKIVLKGWYVGNVSVKDPDRYVDYNGMPTDTNAQAFYQTTVNLMVDAKVTDNVRGFLELETANGGNVNSGLWYWGGGSNGNNKYGNYGNDSKANAYLLFRQAWIQYTGSGLLTVPAGIKAGHMLISLGEKQFLNHERFGDDGILLWVDPTKELHLAIATLKLTEGSVELHADDYDAYVALLTYMWDKDNTVGLNYTCVHNNTTFDQHFDPTYPVFRNYTLHNVGFHGDGMISGLTYAAEVDFQFGDTENYITEMLTKFRGWGIFAKLAYMIDPVNVRASFARGSGDRNLEDGTDGEFETLMGPDYGYTARLVHYTQIYERTVQSASNHAYDVDTDYNPTPSRNTGIANTTYYNLGLDVNPVKELSLSLDGFWLQATKARCGQNGHIGKELDFKGTYKIAKNLNYFVEAGVFWPGRFYVTSDLDPFDGDLPRSTVKQAIHGLSLTF